LGWSQSPTCRSFIQRRIGDIYIDILRFGIYWKNSQKIIAFPSIDLVHSQIQPKEEISIDNTISEKQRLSEISSLPW
jgi:hypothetical protein